MQKALSSAVYFKYTYTTLFDINRPSRVSFSIYEYNHSKIVTFSLDEISLLK